MNKVVGKPTVGVFGTWRASPDSSLYLAAVEMGRAAAHHGFIVMTGAYSGIMEAAVRGAREVGGETVGYSWTKLDDELTPNGYLDTCIRFELAELRLAQLVGDSDICIFFPGRTGTVAELALATELRAKGEKSTPLVLVGDFWSGFFNWMESSNGNLDFSVDPNFVDLYTIVRDAEGFEQYLRTYEYSWRKQ